MPTYNNPISGSMVKYQYVNPDVPTGNTITSNLVANPKTAFASSTSIPESTAVIGGIASIHAAGVISSGLVSLGLTLTIEMAGIVVASVNQVLSVNVANTGWNIDITATILNNGTVEVQGMAVFGGLLAVKNTAPFTMSTAGGVPVTISAQWGALALGGTITMRQMIVQIY